MKKNIDVLFITSLVLLLCFLAMGCDDNLNDPGVIEFMVFDSHFGFASNTGKITLMFENFYGRIPKAKFRAAIEGLTKDSLSFTYETNNGRYITVNSIDDIWIYDPSAFVDFTITRSAEDYSKGVAYPHIEPSAGYPFVRESVAHFNF